MSGPVYQDAIDPAEHDAQQEQIQRRKKCSEKVPQESKPEMLIAKVDTRVQMPVAIEPPLIKQYRESLDQLERTCEHIRAALAKYDARQTRQPSNA